MARRSDHSREELKELAIQAGLEIITGEGFTHFSARKVAARIGYTIGTLYNVFGSYDGLVLHINARTLDHWFEAMQEALGNPKKNDPIHALAAFYIGYSKTHYHAWSALFEYQISEDSTLPEWYSLKMARFFAPVEKTLLPMVNNNRNKAKRAARVLWAGIHGICVLSLSDKLGPVGAESAEILAASFVDNYMAGLMRNG